MSNLLTKNPIILDTTDATSAITGRVKILAIVWDSGASGAAADICLIKNSSTGDAVFSATLNANNQTICAYLGGVEIYGIYLTTLTHGKVYIYIA